EVGVEPCPGPGTRRTAFPVVRHLVLEACRALAELGASKVILMTFHGAPLHNLPIEAGVELLRAAAVPAVGPVNGLLSEMLFLEPEKFAAAFSHVTDDAERTQMMGALASDFHAGFFETSMALHYAPESVAPDYTSLPPCPDVRPDGKFALAARMARALGRDRLSRELTFAAERSGWKSRAPVPGAR